MKDFEFVNEVNFFFFSFRLSSSLQKHIVSRGLSTVAWKHFKKTPSLFQHEKQKIPKISRIGCYHPPKTKMMKGMRGKRSGQLSLSKLQSPITTQWLNENYHIEDGLSLPRSSLYTHYLDFCTNSHIMPVNAASFGKIIRNTFPNLKTRRLGTRGQSKYHYYGITVRTTSPYYHMVLQEQQESAKMAAEAAQKAARAAKLAAAENGGKPPAQKKKSKPKSNHNSTSSNSNATSHHSSSANHTRDSIDTKPSTLPVATGNLLPDFPSVEMVDVEDSTFREQIKTFLIMYKAHCQRILDTILRANFTEVQNFLVHFWQGIPSHIVVILTENIVIELIGQCDNTLYKAIGSVLVPSSLQPLPPSLTQAIQQFAKDISNWLQLALLHMPEQLQQKKLLVAKSFAQQLVRLTSLSHLAQAARTVMTNVEVVMQMAMDFHEIPFDYVIKQVTWMTSSSPTSNRHNEEERIYKYLGEMYLLLEHQAPIEEYADWLSAMIQQCVVKPSEQEDASFQSLAQNFLLKWSFITSKIIQELTLRSAKSFGSFHLLQMLFDDYIFYKIESSADISEEIDDVPSFENRIPSFVMRNKGEGYTDTSNSASPVYFQNRYENLNNNNISPPSVPPTSNFPPVFNFPSNFLTSSNGMTETPTRSKSDYEGDQNRTGNLKYDPINSIPRHDQTSEVLKTDETFYSEDLELVRQLQEKTKSLMDASSKCIDSTNSYDSIYSNYSDDNSIRSTFEKHSTFMNSYDNRYQSYST
ncbi:regulatory factor X 4-like [Clytia hemisphaerica]